MNAVNSIAESIYTAAGEVAGTVYQGADGLYYLYGLNQQFIGTFNPVLNASYDMYGKFINYGNQLRAMLNV